MFKPISTALLILSLIATLQLNLAVGKPRDSDEVSHSVTDEELANGAKDGNPAIVRKPANRDGYGDLALVEELADSDDDSHPAIDGHLEDSREDGEPAIDGQAAENGQHIDPENDNYEHGHEYDGEYDDGEYDDGEYYEEYDEGEYDDDDYDAQDDDDDFGLETVPFVEGEHALPQNYDFRAYRPGDPNRTYGVIVDCGSSGTRVHLYEWDSSLQDLQLLHDIEPMRDPKGKPLSEKFSPGLSSFSGAPTEAIEDYIQLVLNYIQSYIPETRHPYTGVYILATAGMRLLENEEQARITAIVKAYIKAHYSFAKVKTSVMTGAHEGMYQWISVNSKAKRFLDTDDEEIGCTYAVIEMGGASLQVTYRLKDKDAAIKLLSTEEAKEAFKTQIVEPELSRKDKLESTYELLSTTFLGFGSNSAREAYLDLLIHKDFRRWRRILNASSSFIRRWYEKLPWFRPLNQANNRILVLKDPCLPSGFVSEKPLSKPKEILGVRKKAILGYLAEDKTNTVKFKLQGTGDYDTCKLLVEEMLDLAKKERLNCKKDEACTMSLIGEPIINFDKLHVLGIGDIYHTTNLMLNMAGQYKHAEIVSKTREICSQSYDELQTKYQDLIKVGLESRVSDECFKAIWVDTFLVKGLKMPIDTPNLETKGKINGDDLDWTLGAVLDKSLGIEEATEQLQQKLEKSSAENKEEPTVLNEEGKGQLTKEQADSLFNFEFE